MTITPLQRAEYSNKKWRELQQEYANALWMWANIEAQIFIIYASALGMSGKDVQPLRSAFFSINSFEMRLTMTHAAVKTQWGEESQAFILWGELRKKCDKANRKRGKIAHKIGMCYSTPNNLIFALTDPLWHTNHLDWRKAKAEGINAETLKQYAAEWNDLDAMLINFGLVLWNGEPLPTSLSQLADQSRPPLHINVLNPKVPESPPESFQE